MKQGNEVSNPETNTPEVTQTQTNIFQQPVEETTEQQPTEPTPSQKTGKKWLVPALIGMVVLSLGIAGYFVYQNYQLRTNLPTDASPTTTPTTEVSLPETTPTEAVEQDTSLPSNWTKKTSTVCNVQFPLPPKEVPYHHPLDPNREPSVTEDVGSGRYWQYREGPQALFQFTQLATTVYANDTGASGYVSGAVQVYCAPNTDGYDTKQTLNQLNFYLAESQSSGIKIKSSNMTKMWDRDVYELTFEGGMFNSSQQYYLFSTPSNWYLVTKLVQSPTQTVQVAATQIFENLQFLQ